MAHPKFTRNWNISPKKLDTIAPSAIIKSMKILATKQLSKWSKKNDVSIEDLFSAAEEVVNGDFEANLGGHIIKKRVAINSGGKSGGARMILFFRARERLIYIHGFKKNEKANITDTELKAFKGLAKIFEVMTEDQINQSIKSGYFIEVKP